MKVNDLVMKELSDEESSQLWLQFRKESADFDDLCEARDDYVRMQAPYLVVNDLLTKEIKKWDKKLEKVWNAYLDSKT